MFTGDDGQLLRECQHQLEEIEGKGGGQQDATQRAFRNAVVS